MKLLFPIIVLLSATSMGCDEAPQPAVAVPAIVPTIEVAPPFVVPPLVMPPVEVPPLVIAPSVVFAHSPETAAAKKPATVVEDEEKATVAKPAAAAKNPAPTKNIPTAKTKPARPAWVDQPAGLQYGTYQTKVIVGPEPTREACDLATTAAVRAKIQEYITNFSNNVPLEQFDLRDETLFPRVIGEKWEERVTSGGADVVFLHTQVRVDSQLQSRWRATADDYNSRDHSRLLIRVFLSGMWIVAVGHVLLRADERWQQHRGRMAAWMIAVALMVLPFLA